MKKQIIACLLSINFIGCATTANYEKTLDSWIGYSETDLIRKWGPPSQTHETTEAKFLIYTSTRNIFIPGSAPTQTTTFFGNTAYTKSTGGSPSTNLNLSCQTTFELKNDRIASWAWRGNDCATYDWQ